MNNNSPDSIAVLQHRLNVVSEQLREAQLLLMVLVYAGPNHSRSLNEKDFLVLPDNSTLVFSHDPASGRLVYMVNEGERHAEH
jgi:hypothetical protein